MNKTGFWADVRRDYASFWPQMREEFRRMRGEWREHTAEIRQSQ